MPVQVLVDSSPLGRLDWIQVVPPVLVAEVTKNGVTLEHNDAIIVEDWNGACDSKKGQ